MKRFGLLALIGLLFLASFAQAEETPTEDELQPDTVDDDLGAAREGENTITYIQTCSMKTDLLPVYEAKC